MTVWPQRSNPEMAGCQRGAFNFNALVGDHQRLSACLSSKPPASWQAASKGRGRGYRAQTPTARPFSEKTLRERLRDGCGEMRFSPRLIVDSFRVSLGASKRGEGGLTFPPRGGDMNSCHNCGMYSDCASGEGRTVALHVMPKSKFCRETKRTVWCCSDSCAYQALAIARYGLPSYRWPVTLAQFIGLNPLPLRSERTKTPSQVLDSASPKIEKNEFPGLPLMDTVSVREKGLKTRRGGRPRKWESEAERLRAYREKSKSNAEVRP